MTKIKNALCYYTTPWADVNITEWAEELDKAEQTDRADALRGLMQDSLALEALKKKIAVKKAKKQLAKAKAR